MEMRVVLELLTELAPELSIVAPQSFEFVPNIVMRGPNRLLVEFARESSGALAQLGA
jgi:hypothetical protein